MKLAGTFLYVTHDQVEAMSMGDRHGVLNRGRIVQVGAPYEIYNRPRDTFVATFVGSPAMNLFTGAIRDGRLVVAPGRLEIPIGADLVPPVALRASRVILGVRSEDVAVGSGGDLEGHVYAVENHGVEKIVTLKVDEQLVKATVPAQMAIEVDRTVPFTFNSRKLHFFDEESGVRLDS